MNIGLIGYGKMGKMVEAAALARGHSIVTVLDPRLPLDTAKPGGTWEPEKADVLVEFSGPEAAAENIRQAAGMAVVSGSTGWHNELPAVSAAVQAAGGALLWSANFSLGVHLFYRIAAYAAKLADPFAEYDLGGLEIHHNKKADSPSGTAKTLAEKILAVMTRKKRFIWDAPHKQTDSASGDPDSASGDPDSVFSGDPDSVHFASLRAGSVPGVHTVFFDSPADTIEISHTARNREGFASGAVAAAEWLVRCPGPGQSAGEKRRGVFTMDDVLDDMPIRR